MSSPRHYCGSQAADAVVTFNWDVSLDRALHETGRWFVDDGYGVSFLRILDGGWCEPVETQFRYFKLHGSTNWLLEWMTYHKDGSLNIAAPLRRPTPRINERNAAKRTAGVPTTVWLGCFGRRLPPNGEDALLWNDAATNSQPRIWLSLVKSA
jgi:hypothetical protein